MKVELLPGVLEGLQKLQTARCRLAVVTNQQGIGLGYFDTEAFISVNQRMLQLLGPHEIRIARVYHCPHSMADDCPCRKPRGGMLRRAMEEASMTPEQTFLLGDTPVDLAAAQDAGCAAYLAGEGQFSTAVEQVLARVK